ncbi:sugar transferase [Thalassotalea psychrophila]|uniref:Sugar transferase n=1 Tax=Thalassotalea psychrophila TaxID=3065647 RepID=A0ABY9TSD5_9GAMM|nr:sugar transferase [Colwelliaceae bacterium SQ149]
MNNQINIQQHYPFLNEKLVMQYWRNSSVSSRQYVYHKKVKSIRQNVGIPILLQQLIALGLLLLSLPLLLIVALFIYIENPGKVLFCQTRIGENGRHFKFYKFRSMRVNGSNQSHKIDAKLSHRDGICKKYINDPRVTVVGKFIRKYSIDELPQLLNVIIGDMTLVGPRPALASESYQYSQHQFKRLNCKPGMTGLWQISGRADTSFTQQISLDLQYIRQQSFLFDIKILLGTIPAVISAKGAY